MSPNLNPGQGGGAASPNQTHPVLLATDTLWVNGNIESLGEPNFYINQEGLSLFRVNDARIYPWAFTALPATQVNQALINRSKVQLLMFTNPQTINQVRRPPRVETLIFYLPLIVIQGNAPMMGDAKVVNFMDSWKGDFVPLMDVNIHFLTDNSIELPQTGQVVYINRHLVQAYLQN